MQLPNGRQEQISLTPILFHGMDITFSPVRLELMISQQFDMAKNSF